MLRLSPPATCRLLTTSNSSPTATRSSSSTALVQCQVLLPGRVNTGGVSVKKVHRRGWPHGVEDGRVYMVNTSVYRVVKMQSSDTGCNDVLNPRYNYLVNLAVRVLKVLLLSRETWVLTGLTPVCWGRRFEKCCEQGSSFECNSVLLSTTRATIHAMISCRITSKKRPANNRRTKTLASFCFRR